MSDYYYDDPTEKVGAPRRNSLGILASILILIVGGLFIKTTLAANISINSTGSVEFGQGISLTAACSGSTPLLVTPQASFTNAVSSGSFYFNSVTVSGIPAGCNGVDFQISAFDSSTASALSLFNTNSSVATIYDNAGSFQTGHASNGTTVSSGSGTFTVTFTSPVALSTNVSKLTLQSLGHSAYSCLLDGVCNVGDISPSGGTIFYYSAAAFTETGSTCATNCHYLEAAPYTWSGGANDPTTNFWLNGSGVYPINLTLITGTTLGSGFTNTTALITAGDATGASYKARAYTGPGGTTAGQWFNGSKDEIYQLRHSTAASIYTNNPNLPNWVQSVYQTSSQNGPGTGSSASCWSVDFQSVNIATGNAYSQNCTSNNPYPVRPIRAF